MLDREDYPAGVPCWVDTSQPDPDGAAIFYGGLFGWELDNVMPEGSGAKYYMGQLRGGAVGAIAPVPEGAPPMAVWNTYIAVDSADETADRVREAGGSILAEPFDVMEAGRMAVCADPEGAVFSVWQAGQHHGATVVNEAGALNFNGLNTRDVEGAKAFYGAVFGWETLDVGGAFLAWTLPGYGDYLAERTPGLRERMAEAGAQPGFEDVVAAINPITPEQGDVPAHWGVTFGTDDADATAARATRLGGRVIVPPCDAPWVRMTVIADPQGAVFTASKFVPENRDLAAPTSSAAAAA
jgi:predicted enzyme related to lactoylglutathione lyase